MRRVPNELLWTPHYSSGSVMGKRAQPTEGEIWRGRILIKRAKLMLKPPASVAAARRWQMSERRDCHSDTRQPLKEGFHSKKAVYMSGSLRSGQVPPWNNMSSQRYGETPRVGPPALSGLYLIIVGKGLPGRGAQN